MDTSTAVEGDEVTVKLNDRCIEDPASFMTILSQGSCPNSLPSQAFNSSGVASLKLHTENVIGNMTLCIQVDTAHQSRPNSPLGTFEQKLTFKSCFTATINSVASSSVTVEFSLAENSGVVPHGTTATFKPLLCADQLMGAKHATCLNGMWSDLSHRTSSCKSNANNMLISNYC